MQLTALG